MKSQSPGKIAILVALLLLLFYILTQGYYTSRDSWIPNRNSAETPPPTPPPAIDQISCVTTSIGDKVTAAQFKNTSGRQLDEVNAVFVFKTENTKDVTINRYWLSWAPDETKDFTLQDGVFVEKITLTGTCTQGRFDSTWLGGAKTDKRGFNPESKDAPDEQGRKEASIASFGYTREPKETLITRQADKVKRLQETLATQYKELEAKRSTLKEGGEVDQFNKDAAEYAKRVQDLRNEEAFLKGLTEKPKSQF